MKKPTIPINIDNINHSYYFQSTNQINTPLTTNMELKNIAVLGPGGNVGNALITELLKNPTRFNITAISRPTSSYTPPANSNIVAKGVDYNSLDALKEAFTGQDAIINCVTGGATQYDPSKLIIDATVAAGAKFYFANEFVGNIHSAQFLRLPEALTGAKVKIRAYLEGLAKEGKMNWTALNGGPFFDMWLMKGPAGIDIPNRQARIYGTGDNLVYWTPLSTMAKTMTTMLLNPEPVLNRAIYICPLLHTTQNKILATVEKVLDTKFTVTNVDVAKINKHARIALERGETAKAMKGLTVSTQFYEGDSGNDLSGLVENELVGVEQLDLEDAVRQAMERWGMDTPVVQGLYMVDACEI
ncbi:NAD(P)-binding protein [Byssothecium circinans]|uniref:NAD(P)-binding protein n=1 Tax=Byssothecium circinans TaxID=147558 RepID=A0A6A5U9P9_9PLEO|nr:NAD(P)-binding protein [Byssothecium circinans]